MHVCKRLKSFRDSFYRWIHFFFSFCTCPSLFTSLEEISCCCSLILTRRITRPACLHVFTPKRDAERGCTENKESSGPVQNHSIETDRLERNQRISDNASNFLCPRRNFRVTGLAPVRFRVQAINSWVRSNSQKND